MIANPDVTNPQGSGDIENFGQNQGSLATPIGCEALTFDLSYYIRQSLGTIAAKGI